MSLFFDWFKVKNEQPPDDWKQRKKDWKNTFDILTASNRQQEENPWDNRQFHLDETYRKLTGSHEKPYGFTESLPQPPSRRLRIDTNPEEYIRRRSDAKAKSKSKFSPLSSSKSSGRLEKSFMSPFTASTINSQKDKSFFSPMTASAVSERNKSFFSPVTPISSAFTTSTDSPNSPFFFINAAQKGGRKSSTRNANKRRSKKRSTKKKSKVRRR
jgi:hypothetical protein